MFCSHVCVDPERGQLCHWHIGKDFHVPMSVLSTIPIILGTPHILAAINRTTPPKSSQVKLSKRTKSYLFTTMPFGADITNRARGPSARPIAPKKAAAPLACIANGNLRSRRVVLDPPKDIADECMQDASAIMSITPATEMSEADISMATANARGDTTVSMREPTSSSGTDNSEESDEDPHEGVLRVL